jgi:DNA-binding MarR family transcriptional regulator
MELSETLVQTLVSWIEVFMRRSMRNFILYSKQNGLSTTQIATLLLIHRKGAISVSDVGNELQITSPAASQLLERMVQQGLIIRSEGRSDRRLKQIALSEQGDAVLKEGLHARQKWLEDLVRLMSHEEQEQVSAALNLMLAKAQQLQSLPAQESL